MALYVMGDLHLSLGVNKPMDKFGGAWLGYMDKLREGLSVLTPEDTLVLCGDTSWGLSLEEALPDFRYLSALPGRKLLVKGNHDYWWSTAAKLHALWEENGLNGLELLHNNCQLYGELALCGTRGWFYEEDTANAHNEKVFRRELLRLEASLQAAGDREKYVFLHYPPLYRGYECPEILELLERWGVGHCWYGHLHGESHKLALEGNHRGVDYQLAASDYLKFKPLRIRD